jgi:hypothetical protein
LLRWINNGMREFGYAIKFHELEKVGSIPTVNGTVNYGMPADFRVFNEAPRIGSPQTRFWGILTPETRLNFLRSSRFPQTSSYGRPTFYHLYSNQLWLRATPDATVMTVDFDYWAKITPLAAPTDVSQFSDDWDDAIFRAALYRGYIGHGEHDRAINAFNFFLGLVRSRIDQEELEEFPEGGISYIQSQFDAQVR